VVLLKKDTEQFLKDDNSGADIMLKLDGDGPNDPNLDSRIKLESIFLIYIKSDYAKETEFNRPEKLKRNGPKMRFGLEIVYFPFIK